MPLPHLGEALTRVLPFRYALAFPVDTLLGAVPRAVALRDLGVQVGFAASTSLLAFGLFRRGVRRYGVFGG